MVHELTKTPFHGRRNGPVVLCIMDGIGYGKFESGDAVRSAPTPTLDWLHANHPTTQLKAHGTAVGMPSDSDMGNSEVGHNAIGAGRVFAQGAKLVGNALRDGTLFDGDTWQELIANCISNQTTLHFLGLLSDGSVHSHIDHLTAMLRHAHAEGVRRVRVHTLLDGRDVGERSALDYVSPLEALLAELNGDGADYRIASGGGRMQITMDRYNADWDMVRRGWDVHIHGRGRQFDNATEAIETLRTETNAIDQDLPPFVIAENGQPVGPVRDGDSVILFNYRGDRAMEMTAAFEDEEFTHFDRSPRPEVTFAGMMEYDSDMKIPRRFLVRPPELDRTMGEYLATTGVAQWAVSETQKYGHVTYFFNGNRSAKFNDDLEHYVEIPSYPVPFAERPWMRAAEITDSTVAAITGGNHPFIRLNYPNGDMIGHTGNYQATELAVAAVDLCIARLLPVVRSAGGILVLCADHGNADDMFEHASDGTVKMNNGTPQAKTCHSLNPVPCIIYDPGFSHEYQMVDGTELGISSLAATCLSLLGYQPPDDYDPAVIKFNSR